MELKRKIALCLVTLVVCIMTGTLLAACAQPDKDTAEPNPVVEFVFSTGDKVRFELYPDQAPITVKNFLRYVNDGFYAGTIIHRVEAGVVQGGGYTVQDEQYIQKSTYAPIKGEFSANGVNNTLPHCTGAISMARTKDYDSATSQFFFCPVDQTAWWDGYYAAFGMAADQASIDAIKRLSQVPTHDRSTLPIETISIQSVKVIN